ncbi:MAG: hypothetical protein MZV70_71440 [Desulfobacterales bacterium]|nr:hypothetical protein [Desulfobacterales bacterium]
MTLGGPAATRPGHFRTRIGAPLAALTDGRTAAGEVRLVAGGVLTREPRPPGTRISAFSKKRLCCSPRATRSGDFLGLDPARRTNPSYSRTFLSSFRRHREFPLDCNRHGGLRGLHPVQLLHRRSARSTSCPS